MVESTQPTEIAKESVAETPERVEAAADRMTDALPTAPELKNEATPQSLLERLNWGEPALTILDVREREAFNAERITGAISMPMSSLAGVDLESNRDIYVYGIDDSQTAQAAGQLRDVGFTEVAELKGGLPAWKAVSGPTEGTQG